MRNLHNCSLLTVGLIFECMKLKHTRDTVLLKRCTHPFSFTILFYVFFQLIFNIEDMYM